MAWLKSQLDVKLYITLLIIITHEYYQSISSYYESSSFTRVSACLTTQSGIDLGAIHVDKILANEGANLTVVCSLNPLAIENFFQDIQHSRINSSLFDLKFHHLNKNGQMSKKQQTDSYRKFQRTIVNDLTVKFTKENISIEDSALYDCALTIPDSYSTTSNNFQEKQNPCIQIVHVLRHEINCRFEMYTSLECSWRSNYQSTDSWIQYNLKYQDESVQINGSHSSLYSCPYMPDKSQFCRWDWTTDPKHPFWNQCLKNGSVTLMLTAHELAGSGYLEWNITKPCSEVAKLPEPKKFAVRDKNGTSVVVEWQNPYLNNNVTKRLNLDYKIQLSYRRNLTGFMTSGESVNGMALHDSISEASIEKNLDDNINNYTLTDLTPNMQHIINARLLSVNPGLGDSDIVTYTFKTGPAKPNRAPFIEHSSFEIQEFYQDQQKFRTISIYWQYLELIYHYGDHVKYSVGFYESFDGDYFLQGSTSNTSGTCLSEHSCAKITFNKLRIDRYYLFHIFSSNECGESDYPSEITVPPQDKILLKPKHLFAVMLDVGHYNLHWIDIERKRPEKISEEYYTLFWCSDYKLDTLSCQSMDGSLNQSSTSTWHNLQIQAKPGVVHRFAISYNLDQQTSGLLWAACTISHAASIQFRPYVSIVNPSSIKVSWTFHCTSQQAVVTQYKFKFCSEPLLHADSETCGRPIVERECHTKVVWPNSVYDNLILFEDLKPFSRYNISMTVIKDDSIQANEILEEINMPEQQPTDPPSDLSLFQNGNLSVTMNSILLKWQPPIHTNGPNYYYYIIYKSHDSKGETKSSTKIAKTLDCLQVYKLDNLESFTSYSIFVHACIYSSKTNKESCSPKSKELLVKTKSSKPSKMDKPNISYINKDLIDQHQKINVTWKPPEHPNGLILSYSLFVEAGSIQLLNLIFNSTENYKLIDLDCLALIRLIDSANDQSKMNGSSQISMKMVGLSISAITEDHISDKSDQVTLVTFCNNDLFSVIIYSVLSMALLLFIMIILAKVCIRYAKLKKKYRGITPNLPPKLMCPQLLCDETELQCKSIDSENSNKMRKIKSRRPACVDIVQSSFKKYPIDYDPEDEDYQDSMGSETKLSKDSGNYNSSIDNNHLPRNSRQSADALALLGHQMPDYVPYDHNLSQERLTTDSNGTSNQSIDEDEIYDETKSIHSNGSFLANLLKETPATTSIAKETIQSATNAQREGT